MPEKIMFIIMTDGLENVSRRYTYEKVQSTIKRQQEKYGWEFLFLGANIDTVAEAKRFGIEESRAANFHCDEEGTLLNYEVIRDAIMSVRCGGALPQNWKARIDEDYKKRGGRK